MKRIGITINLTAADYSVWANGMRQNIFFLAKTFMALGRYEVLIVNTNPATPITSKLPWDQQVFKTVNFDDVKDSLDLLVLLGSEVSPSIGHALRKRGCPVVLYECGNRYVIEKEEMLFKGGKGKLHDMSFLDEIWIIPQMSASCTHYLEVTFRTPVIDVPFVWGTDFIEAGAADLPNRARYVPRAGAKRVACFEPNLNVYKFCMYCILVAEKAYRMRPELMSAMFVTNTERLKQQERFTSIMQSLDLVRNGIASFEDRYPMPSFLAKYTDVVLAFQWENALNYSYLDALHLGYPLVHNAHFIRDAGYYYEGFDAAAGAQQLVTAMERHDEQLEDYGRRSAQVLRRFAFDNPESLATYDRLLSKLLR